MNLLHRTLFVCLIIVLASTNGFSQNPKPKKDQEQLSKEQPSTNETNAESTKSSGLRKIAGPRDLDMDINIDEEALEANIESAMENAMKSIDIVLENLEINIEPVEIDLTDLNIDIDPVEINIPDLDINIEPIEVDMDDMDIDIDIDKDDFYWDDSDDDNEVFEKKELNFQNDKDKEKDKEKEKLKDKSDKSKKYLQTRTLGNLALACKVCSHDSLLDRALH